MQHSLIENLSPELPVLIAGPTASGKSALALAIAQAQGGVIVNADALQVYDNWHLLTARPGPDDLRISPHALYGHVARTQPYSVGHWLRQVAPLLDQSLRPIIVGGTGLYFMALTEGLAEIPSTPPGIRAEADTLSLEHMRAELAPQTAARIDLNNRARVQRAWEVARATGQSLHLWQALTPPPLLPLARAQPLLVTAGKDWLGTRIARRFDKLLEAGALEEARGNLDGFDPARPADKAIGAPELVSHLRGEISVDTARQAAVVATRQYAKRQRTWFRARMKKWQPVPAEDLEAERGHQTP